MFVFFKQKTAYDMRISDWSSDVCSSDLNDFGALRETLFTFDWGEHTFWHNLVPRSPDSAVDLRWVIALALVGLVLSLFFRIRAGWLIGAFVIVAGVAFVVAPQGRLWTARLLPLYYLSPSIFAPIGVPPVGRPLSS